RSGVLAERRRGAAAGADHERDGPGGVDGALVVTGCARRLAHVVETLVEVVVAGEDDVGPGLVEHAPVGVGLDPVGRRIGYLAVGIHVAGHEAGAVPHGDDVLVGGGGLLQVAGQP